MMQEQDLLRAAEEAGKKRARPLESNFAVGVALRFSNGSVYAGANYQDIGRTPVGACAERTTMMAANNSIGPLGARDVNPSLLWEQLAVWSPLPDPITPCGICRDALATTSMPDAEIISGNIESGAPLFRTTIRDLFPLSGNGFNRDVREEIEIWRKTGGPISDSLTREQVNLLSKAQLAAEKSYIPPFSKEPAAGAALELADGSIVEGWFVVDATTRLGGSAITSAVRRMLVGPVESTSRVIRVALFTKSDVLRAPNGYDLQLLHEVVASPSIPIAFSNLENPGFSASLDALYPFAFGRKDLGY